MTDNPEQRATVRRIRLSHGDPPAFEVTSPCCGQPSVLAAWMIDAARLNTDGRLLVECGRHTTDPLRPAGAGKDGCGRRYVVRVDQDLPVVEGGS